jgi:2,5-diamino-6-(ribosylamino)-4(3H)-pyrimidinone 5'-phosphate reductase
MVEGGARVIRSFFAASASSSLVDSIIVTVAPIFVGDGVGYSYDSTSENFSGLKHVFTEVVGRDSVIGLVPIR